MTIAFVNVPHCARWCNAAELALDLVADATSGGGCAGLYPNQSKGYKFAAYPTYALDNLGGLSLSLRRGCNHASKNDEGGGGSGEELDKLLSEVFSVQQYSKLPSS